MPAMSESISARTNVCSYRSFLSSSTARNVFAIILFFCGRVFGRLTSVKVPSLMRPCCWKIAEALSTV